MRENARRCRRRPAAGRTHARRSAALACALLALVLPLAAIAKPPPEPRVRHPFLAAQPDEVPASAVMAVEIPAGGAIKYEIGSDGLVFVDRFLPMPVAYPANYGSLPRTLAGDGDPLDALVLTRAPLPPGVLVRFRPIGVLRMVDGGERDEKIIGVPVDAVDAVYAGIHDIDDVPAAERTRIEAFFRLYKDTGNSTNPVQLSGFGDAAEARALLREAIARFAARDAAPP